MPLVIFDGSDCSGKTTICKLFAEYAGGSHYTHMTYRHKHMMHQYHAIGLRHCVRKLNEFPIVTLDRSWMSEAVYAAVYRTGSSTPHSGRILQKIINMVGGQTVICSGDPNVIAERHAKSKETRFEMYSGGMDKVAAAYNLAWEGDYHYSSCRSYLDFLIYNGGMKQDQNCHYYQIGDDTRALFDKVTAQAKVADGNIRHYAFGGNSNVAKFVLIGDKVNYPRPERVSPFIADKNSSLFLAETLQELGLFESDICYYNVNDAPHLISEVAGKFGKNCIVLGRRAQKTLIDYDKSLGCLPCIPHPAWAKRFSNLQGYCNLLGEVLSTLNLDIPSIIQDCR